MKWFLLLFILMGVYVSLLLSTASIAIDKTAGLYEHYESVANQTAQLQNLD